MVALRKSEPMDRVLLIEDDDVDAELVERSLRTAHSNIVSRARTLNEGKRLLDSEQFSVVLLDLNLPDSSGIATFISLAEKFQNLPVIILSGSQAERDAEVAVKKGAQDYIPKSGISGDALQRSINYAIERNSHKVTMRHMYADSLKSVAQKSRFMSQLSHEIRNPMSGIIATVESILAKGIVDNRETTESLELIKASGEHLIDLVNDILDLAKLEAGKMQVNKTFTNIRSVADDIFGIFGTLLQNKKLFSFSLIASNTPDRIMCDPMRLRQILTNLISNAIKFTQTGSVYFIAELVPDWSFVKFSVRDTGPGISVADQKKLFKEFEQVGTNDSNIAGTGLGLSICKNLVEAQGGTIGVDSIEGEGATFWFTLPTGGNFAWNRKSQDYKLGLHTVAIISDRHHHEPISTMVQMLGARSVIMQPEDIDHTMPEDAFVLIPDQNLYWRNLLLEVTVNCPNAVALGFVSEAAFREWFPSTMRYIQVPILSRSFIDAKKQVFAPVAKEPWEEAMKDKVVLIVEDDPINRKVMCRWLKDFEAKSICVGSGEEALVSMAKQKPDIIFMDHFLPGMNGIETSAKIRAIDAQAMIISITGSRDSVNEEAIQSVGIKYQIVKPVRLAGFKAILKEVLTELKSPALGD